MPCPVFRFRSSAKSAISYAVPTRARDVVEGNRACLISVRSLARGGIAARTATGAFISTIRAIACRPAVIAVRGRTPPTANVERRLDNRLTNGPVIAKKSGSGGHYRSAISGRYVSTAHGKRRPDTTELEKTGGGASGSARSAKSGRFVTARAAKQSLRTTVNDA